MKDPIQELGSTLGASWPTLSQAKQDAASVRQRISQDIVVERKAVPQDTSMVVFGSLAREEWTSGSDVDWTLVVDGSVDPEHSAVVRTMTGRLVTLGYKRPGPTRVFGTMSFSHELVHQIGGDEDTNRNTTRRMLLLLESREIGAAAEVPGAHGRVIKNILSRYLRGEAHHLDADGKTKVPRFLLNDVVRFWRTMAVDFVRKQSEQDGEDWGLRNAKLQVSRKLLFVSGLLMCFGCRLFVALHPSTPKPEQEEALIAYLSQNVRYTPLQVLASNLLALKEASIARELFACYESFLALLNDPQKREHLKGVGPETARKDPVYQEAKQIAARFETNLLALFFENDKLKPLTRKYGVF